MSLGKRIERLETAAEAEPVRCAHCADWPMARVVFDPEVNPSAEDHELPECCPVCVWKPTHVIKVCYEEEKSEG